MRFFYFIFIFSFLTFPGLSRAGLISGFENGLSQWEVLGDVSVQDSSIGLGPTQGSRMAFVTTLCNADNPPPGSLCNTTDRELPFSGTSSQRSQAAREFLGLSPSTTLFMASMPSVPSNVPGGGMLDPPPTVGESGALKMRFYVSQAGILTFDWDRIGRDSDSAYYSVWADDPMESFRFNNWIYYPTTFQGTFNSTDVDLCARYRSGLVSACDQSGRTELRSELNVHTGWGTKATHISNAGWYWLGIGLGEIAEGTVPTVLALDNVQFFIPEPAGLILCLTALLLGVAVPSFVRSRR